MQGHAFIAAVTSFFDAISGGGNFPEEGQPVSVGGVVISSAGGATVELIRNGDGPLAGTLYKRYRVGAGLTFTDETAWYAESGIDVDVVAGTADVTFHHTHAGS